MGVLIATDSAADFTTEELIKYDILCINLPVIFDGEAECIKSNEEFWKKLIDGKVAKTSQPAPDSFKTLFEAAKKNNDELIFISISSRLSGTYSGAVTMKSIVGYDKIHIIDSYTAAIAEKLIAIEAAKLRDSGLAAREIVSKIEEFKSRVKIYACIDTLKYLARGGRISKTTASIGNLVNIKPVITVENGLVENVSKSIGISRATSKLIEIIQSYDVDNNYKIIPAFSHSEVNLPLLIKKLQKQNYEFDNEIYGGIGPTIGTHIGPSGFGFVFVEKK